MQCTTFYHHVTPLSHLARAKIFEKTVICYGLEAMDSFFRSGCVHEPNYEKH